MKKLTIKKIIYCFLILIFSANCTPAKQFSDIPRDFWAYNEINELSDNGLISGYENNTFRPNKYITRAEYSVLILKALGKEDIPIEQMYTFEDVKNTSWYWKYIIRAVNLDILKPASENYFYPDDYVARSEIITFLSNLLKTEQISKKDAIMALQNEYLDFDDIPDWFKVRAGKAEILGVIAKEPPREHYLDYDSYITRAQMAVFLAKLADKVNEYKQEEIRQQEELERIERAKNPFNTWPDDIKIVPEEEEIIEFDPED